MLSGRDSVQAESVCENSVHSWSSQPVMIIACIMLAKQSWNPHPAHNIKPDHSIQTGCALFQSFEKSDFQHGFSGKDIAIAIYRTEPTSLFFLNNFLPAH